MLRRLLLATLIALCPLAASAHEGVKHEGCAYGQTFTQGSISVSGAYVRATLKNASAAGGYLTITNTGSTADRLMSVTSAAATDISVHQMKMNGQVMEMSAIEGGLEVPAGGSVSLDPMGYHLMMTGMSQPFIEGQCVEMTLHFASAGDLPIELNIGGVAQDGPPTDAPHDTSNMSSMDMSGMSSMQM